MLENRYIIHAINNAELEKADAEPDDYFGVNIRPAYIIPEVQTKSLNYICYTVGFKDVPQWDKTKQYLQLTFVIMCEQKNLIDKETSLARHDLIGALIQDQFNFTNYFGAKIKLVSDQETVVDNNYVARTMIFEQIADNNLVRDSRFANKEIRTRV